MTNPARTALTHRPGRVRRGEFLEVEPLERGTRVHQRRGIEATEQPAPVNRLDK